MKFQLIFQPLPFSLSKVILFFTMKYLSNTSYKALELLKSANTAGRIPILEYLENNREIRDAILEQKTILEIEKIMKKQKFISMQDYAQQQGITMQG